MALWIANAFERRVAAAEEEVRERFPESHTILKPSVVFGEQKVKSWPRVPPYVSTHERTRVWKHSRHKLGVKPAHMCAPAHTLFTSLCVRVCVRARAYM